MPEEKKSWLDSMLDAAEGAMDRVEKHEEAVVNSGGWKVTEVIEEDDTRFWDVSNDGTRKIHVYQSERLAERLASLLNGGVK